MNLEIQSIKIHHFLSYEDAEINFKHKGYCLIKGINHNPKDNAESNGSGKSTILSAICWTLTGETIQGIKTNLANIYFNDGCWVELNFNVDGHSYKVIRYKEDTNLGTDLKIYVDGEDKSGKGIKESSAILEQLLPDLNTNLISNVILLGQGMPNKFSGNTPAGRKQVLEELSKSDFMIEDVKNRIDVRANVLSNKMKTIQEDITKLTTSKTIYNQNLEQQKEKLKELEQPKDFDTQISCLQSKIKLLETNIPIHNQSLTIKENEKTDLNSKILSNNELINSEIDKIQKEKLFYSNTSIKSLAILKGQETVLSSEIKKLDTITDICPTCGQKIPGVLKKDTSKLKEELNKLTFEIEKRNQELSKYNNDQDKKIVEIRHKYDSQLKEIREKQLILDKEIHNLKTTLSTSNEELTKAKVDLATITSEKNAHLHLIEETKKQITTLIMNIEDIDKTLKEDVSVETKLQEHIDVVSKMNTLAKRDFRGFLLKNIIKLIEDRAKEYSQDIFGTKEITFEQSGNSIDISYCNRAYESLSGGEKQKIDVILQLSIRDMLSQYLDFHCNIIFLDELTDNLDAIGCEKIIDLISKRLSDIESIFIISHRADTLNIPNDNVLMIEKDENGVSKITQQ